MAVTEIGPYRILRLIKHGGGGSVYVGYDQRLQRRVALKLVPVPAEREARQEVIAEARHLAALNHRSIVQIFDVLETHSHVVLVMEYVEGTDLQELLAATELDLAASLHLAAELSGALSAAHAAGLVHRDLKPANVLLDPGGGIKLTDFGIAQLVPGPQAIAAEDSESIAQARAQGSLLALSPEHLPGHKVDPRSDLFALGLLIYRLFAGRHPFIEGDARLFALPTLAAQPPQPLAESSPAVPAALSELVNALLARDPQARPASALDVRQLLLAIMRELPVAQGKPLAKFLQGMARSEDTVPTGADLPQGFARGARSLMLPPRDWGPWAFGAVATWRQSVALALVVLCATSLIYAGVQAVDLLRAKVYVQPVRLVGAPESSPNSAELSRILDTAIDAHIGLERSISPAAAPLELQVECNSLVCTMQLVYQRDGLAVTEYLSLLPGSPVGAWENAVEKGLDALF